MFNRVNVPRRLWADPRPNLRRRCISLAISLFLAFAGLSVASAGAAATEMVDLGEASTYGALSGASIGNTVSAPGAPHTTIRGDVGVKANTAPTGFPPGVATGTIRFGSSVDQAHADAVSAYADIAARTGGVTLAGALAGATVLPGLYTIAGAASNTSTLTLDGGGDPNAVFVFQVNGALSFAAASQVVLTNGARASRVFWQVNGAGGVGAGSIFAGTMIAMDAVAIGNGTIVNGRLIARTGALTLDNNQVYSAPPVVTIDGGVSAQTTDTTPTLSGTTDVEAPGVVTVTIAGQTLTATPAGGVWSVTSAILANDTYPVLASVVDGADNPGSASQQLTVDTVLPEITLDGGTSVTTNDSTPTISGSSDVAAGTIVRVNIGSQNLFALVNASGTWNVGPAVLLDGNYTVSASVNDPAGNESTATQLLTIDTTAPAVSITGGSVALTNDATPTLSGTAAVASGTTVTVTVANQTLTGQVGGSQTWSVTSEALSDGPHRFVMAVSDIAGNQASAEQMLTIDTVAPQVAINGGAAATTTDASPTISGSSDAAPGTTVTVSVAQQTLTTLLQANGSWNTNPGSIGDGVWQIQASAEDPAGNVGSASQTLSINPSVTPTSFELKVTRTGNGQGTVRSTPAGIQCGSDCYENLPDGTLVTLIAPAARGSNFTGWGGDCSGRLTCVVTMDQTRAVSASFADKAPVVIALKVVPGKVSLSGKRKNTMRRLGPLVKLKLTEVAKVRFRITKKFTKARSFRLRLKAGSSSVRIPVKIRRKLDRGSYRLTAVATDAIGQASKKRQVGFKVVR